jgi:two-component system, OmpR family, response regulator
MKTVLVVDDSDVVLEIVKKNLETAGYNVITRNKPSGSVAAILRDKPDVVLLDVNMPTLSGDTIAKILGRVSQSAETLVLLHSSLSIDNLRLKSIATRAHGYIQKTDSPTELVRRIEYWLNRRPPASASRMDAAAAPETTAGAEAPSSGRMRAAPRVAPDTSTSVRAPGSANIAAAPPAGPGPLPSSSSRWRAAPVTVTGPPTGAVASRSGASSGAFRVAPAVAPAEPSARPTASTPTSRNMRAAKPIGGSRLAKVLFVDDDWKMLSSYRIWSPAIWTRTSFRAAMTRSTACSPTRRPTSSCATSSCRAFRAPISIVALYFSTDAGQIASFL